MNKKLSKVISSATLAAVSVFTLSDSQLCYVDAVDTNEKSYRTYCINTYGDLNDDGYTDTFDVIKMRKIVVENEYSVLADLNHDQKVDADDLTMLNDYVLGKM